MIQTVSLETAKLLKEAGFRQDTHFCYSFDNGYHVSESRVSLFGQEIYAAPTTDELLSELPFFLNDRFLTIRKLNGYFSVAYMFGESWYCEQSNELLQEAIAQIWLYLKKEGLLEPSKGADK